MAEETAGKMAKQELELSSVEEVHREQRRKWGLDKPHWREKKMGQDLSEA